MTTKKVTLRMPRLSLSLVLLAGLLTAATIDQGFVQIYEKNECHDPDVTC